MISEATPVCAEGHGYPCTPGIHTPEQTESWKPVVQAVHDKGAFIFCQLWHGGRASHPDFQPNEALPVAPSAIAITGDDWKCYTMKGGPFDYPVPRELAESEIPAIVEAFATGAKNAVAAGFDGVEIHSANGYLLNQFLADGSNKRTDSYGGSVENRCRLTLEVVDAVIKAVGAAKVGIRLAPYNMFLDVTVSSARCTRARLQQGTVATGQRLLRARQPDAPRAG